MPPSNADRCEARVGKTGDRCQRLWHHWYMVRPVPAPHSPGGLAGYSGPMALCNSHLGVVRRGKQPVYLADAAARALGNGGPPGARNWRPGPPANYFVEGHPEYRQYPDSGGSLLPE